MRSSSLIGRLLGLLLSLNCLRAVLVIATASPPEPAHVTQQPRTIVSTNLTLPVAMLVLASGTPPLRYQWFRDGVALPESDGYSGTSSPELTIQGGNLLTTAGYHVEVANDSGRERSATALAGIASGTMDFGFTTNSLTGRIRTDGVPFLPFGISAIFHMVADTGPHGKARRILLIGSFAMYDDVPAPGLVIVHPDGSRDSSWNPPAGVTGSQTAAAAFLADGRVVLAGLYARASGAPRDAVMRLNPDGSLDDSFDPGDELAVAPPPGFSKQSYVDAVAPDGDGLFIASPPYGGEVTASLRRLKADGKTDTGFLSTNLSLGGNPLVLTVEPGGKHGLLVSGRQFSAESKTGDSGIFRGVIRVLRDDRLDTSYNAPLPGSTQNEVANGTTLLPLPDGGVIMAGDFPTLGGGLGPLVHLDALGRADTDFFVHLAGSPSQSYTNTQLQGLAPLADGNFLLDYYVPYAFPDQPLLMRPDGTLIMTAGGPVAAYRPGTSPILSLGDGSYLAPIYVEKYRATVGRFFLRTLSRTPVTNVPPVILHAPADVALTNRSGYREPLVLSAVVQAGGEITAQWYRDGVLVSEHPDTTLIIANPRPQDSGRYRIEVSNPLGSVSAEAQVVITVAAPEAPRLSAERYAGDPRIHLHFSPQPSARYHLERGIDFGTWGTITDPAVRVSDSEFAPALEAGSVFFRLVLEP